VRQVCPSATLTLAPARRPLEGIIIIPTAITDATGCSKYRTPHNGGQFECLHALSFTASTLLRARVCHRLATG
jgi:hypothetical protein